MTRGEKQVTAIVVVVILLVIFLIYYFTKTSKEEKCPDGRGIPSSGDCGDNPIRLDSAGQQIVTPIPSADNNGCIPPSSYKTNAFPLGVGMRGDLVKQWQKGMNKTYKAGLAEDGYLGCKSLNAAVKYLNTQSIDAEVFKNVTEGKVASTTTTIAVGNNLYAKYGQVKVYNTLSDPNDISSVYKTAAKDEYIGKVSSIVSDHIYVGGDLYWVFNTNGAYYSK